MQLNTSSSLPCYDTLSGPAYPTLDTLTIQAPSTLQSSIGGSVSGLGGGSVVLLNNGGGATTVSADGNYFHNTAVASGSPYAITVQTPPAGRTCTVTAGGSGTADGSNVITANVICAVAQPYTIGGTVSGLATGETVILKNNGADDTPVASNTTFAFPTSPLGGAAYAVTVGTAPTGKTCTVSNGTGTVGSANVTNVVVACAATTPASIPTLSEWSMIFLSSLIAMVGIATVRRRNG